MANNAKLPILTTVALLLVVNDSFAESSKLLGSWKLVKNECFEKGSFLSREIKTESEILKISSNNATRLIQTKSCKISWKWRLEFESNGLVRFKRDGVECTPFPCEGFPERVLDRVIDNKIEKMGLSNGYIWCDREILKIGSGKPPFLSAEEYLLSIDNGQLVMVPADASIEFFCREHFERN